MTMKKNIYIRNIQSQGNKRVSYEISNDCTHWVGTEDFRVELLNSIGSGDFLKIIPLKDQDKELWIRYIRSLKEECAHVGTTDFRVNVEKRSFWLNGKPYFISDDLRGLGAKEMSSIGRNIMVFDFSMDCGEKWNSGICKEDNPLIEIPSDYKTIDNKDDIKQSNQNHTFELIDYFDYDKSFQKHALSIMMLRPEADFLYYVPEDDTPLWMFNGSLYCEQDERLIGASAFIWIKKHYDQKEDFCYLLDVLDEQIAHIWVRALEPSEKLLNDIKRYTPSFKLVNDLKGEKIHRALGWAWIDLHAILHFIDYCTKYATTIPVKNKQRIKECATIEDLADLFLSDMGITNRFEAEDLPF